MTLRSDIQLQVLTPLIALFILEIPADTPIIFRFVTHKTTKNTAVVWQGQTYTRYPIRIEGFSKNIQGRLPRPVMSISNVGGGISEFLLAYDDLNGAKITRIRTLAKYLDAVNFPGNVNPNADPTQEFPREIWSIDRKSNENLEFAQFELCSPFDIPNTVLPANQLLPACQYQYRNAECGYAGGPVATDRNVATSDPVLDRCSKSVIGCKLRFGANAELPFGGEPGIGLLRL